MDIRKNVPTFQRKFLEDAQSKIKENRFKTVKSRDAESRADLSSRTGANDGADVTNSGDVMPMKKGTVSFGAAARPRPALALAC